MLIFNDSGQVKVEKNVCRYVIKRGFLVQRDIKASSVTDVVSGFLSHSELLRSLISG